jgi:hypothetical protein
VSDKYALYYAVNVESQKKGNIDNPALPWGIKIHDYMHAVSDSTITIGYSVNC